MQGKCSRGEKGAGKAIDRLGKAKISRLRLGNRDKAMESADDNGLG